MPIDKFSIVPDLHTPEYDAEEYRHEHWAIFGHWPPDNVDEKCQHPIHDAVRREMNGAFGITPFDPNEIASEDSVLEAERLERYDMVVRKTKQFQKMVEEQELQERLQQAGLVPFRKVF